MLRTGIEAQRAIDDAQARRCAHRRAVALALGPIAGVSVYLAPLPALTPPAHTLAAILAWVVIYWITEPIPLPITALLGTVFCVVAGLGSPTGIFASYGHPIIFLFVGSFLLAEALAVHGMDRRLAIWLLSLPWVEARPARILLALGAATAIVSMWISNTAATALMLPIGTGILTAFGSTNSEDERSYRTGLLLMLSYAATAGGLATLIGTPPNIIGVGLIAQQTKITISFLAWLAVGLPLAVLMLLSAWTLLGWLHPSSVSSLPALKRSLRDQRSALGPWTAGQRNACIAFTAAIVLWIVPGLLTAFWGPTRPLVHWLNTHLPSELAALFAASLLFVLPTDFRSGTFTLSWRQAANINWGILLLFGGGLAFGELISTTGLSGVVGEGFVNVFGVHTLWGLTAVSIVAGALISELASNTASASMLVPLVIAVAQASGIPPLPPALGACLGASLGSALPISTPPNAIVYSTALVPIKSMVRAGLLFDTVGAILIWLILRIMCPLIGLA